MLHSFITFAAFKNYILHSMNRPKFYHLVRRPERQEQPELLVHPLGAGRQSPRELEPLRQIRDGLAVGRVEHGGLSLQGVIVGVAHVGTEVRSVPFLYRIE